MKHLRSSQQQTVTSNLAPSPINNSQLAIVYYDEEGLANVKLPSHPCPHCSESRDHMTTVSHVYGLTVCQTYFNEALAQLKGYGVRILAIVAYEPYEEVKGYTVVKVRGNLRYTMDSGIMYSRP